jgi:hypothetical protein
MPESHLAPYPVATLLSQGSSPRQPGVLEPDQAASVGRSFGTSADIWSVYAYYQGLLKPLGWSGSNGSWRKGSYYFEISVGKVQPDASGHERFFLVYEESLRESLSVTAPPGLGQPGATVPVTPSPTPDTDPGHWTDGLPRTLSGQPVYRGNDIAAIARERSEDSPFLIGGYVRGVQGICGGECGQAGPYLVDTTALEVTPPYVRLVLPPQFLWTSSGRVVIQVHVGRSPGPCAPAPTYCPATLDVDKLVWPEAPLPSKTLGTRTGIEQRLTEAAGYAWTGGSASDESHVSIGTSGSKKTTCWVSGPDGVVTGVDFMSVNGAYDRTEADLILNALMPSPDDLQASDWVAAIASGTNVHDQATWTKTFDDWAVEIDAVGGLNGATGAIEVTVTPA